MAYYLNCFQQLEQTGNLLHVAVLHIDQPRRGVEVFSHVLHNVGYAAWSKVVTISSRA